MRHRLKSPRDTQLRDIIFTIFKNRVQVGFGTVNYPWGIDVLHRDDRVLSAMFKLLLMFLLSFTSAVTVGLLGAALTRDLYIPLLTALAMGGVAGAALGFFVHFLRIQSKAVVYVAAVFVSLACMLSFHWGEYQWHFKPEVRLQTEFAGLDNPQWNDTDEERVVQGFLSEHAGQHGFWGFLKYRFESGVGLRFFRTDLLGKAGTALLWLLELALLMALVFRISVGAHAVIDPIGESKIVTRPPPPL